MRDVRQEGLIRIAASVEGTCLRLLVADNGVGFDAKQSKARVGIALSSTRERLARMYPDRHSFTIRDAVPKGSEVLIEIPFQYDGTPVAATERQRALADR